MKISWGTGSDNWDDDHHRSRFGRSRRSRNRGVSIGAGISTKSLAGKIITAAIVIGFLGFMIVPMVGSIGPVLGIGEYLKVERADVQLRLNQDASVTVREELKYVYHGKDFRGGYREIPLDLTKQQKLTVLSVGDEENANYRPGAPTEIGSLGEPFSYGVRKLSDGSVRIVWHYPPTGDSRTFSIRYRLDNVVDAYNDVLDINAKVWGSEWDFSLKELDSEILLPGVTPATPGWEAWTRPLGTKAEVEKVNGAVRSQATDIPLRQWFEVRTIVPKNKVNIKSTSAANVINANGAEKIKAEMADEEDHYNSTPIQFVRSIDNLRVPIAVFIVIGFWLVAAWLLYRAREENITTPKYLSTFPDDASPIDALRLIHEGDVPEEAVLATLLDLTERNFYITEFRGLDMALSINEAGRDPKLISSLTRGEQAVIVFFDQLVGSGSKSFKEMKDSVPEHSETWRNRWQTMWDAVSAPTGVIVWDDIKSARWRGYLVGVTIVVLIGFALALLPFRGEFYHAWIAGLCLLLTVPWVMFIPKKHLEKTSEKTRARSLKWQSFSRWTKDFPNLDDAPEASIAVWEKIMVYAVAFGTAEKMAKSGKMPTPDRSAFDGTANNGLLLYWIATPGFHDDYRFHDSFQSQVAPEPSSGSAGGGSFGGGGGGGFGGGGGGGW